MSIRPLHAVAEALEGHEWNPQRVRTVVAALFWCATGIMAWMWNTGFVKNTKYMHHEYRMPIMCMFLFGAIALVITLVTLWKVEEAHKADQSRIAQLERELGITDET